MGNVKAHLSMSLDGYVAGPEPTLEEPLGRGGERLHEWAFRLKTFRELHGMPGGETGPDDDVIAAWHGNTGATIMGRRMFSGGSGPWETDPNADGWWGDDPPFRHPVFVLTHHPRQTVEKQNRTSYVFVTDGPGAGLEQAQAAAGAKDVEVGGGAEVVQQFLNAGLLNELNIHLVPVLLGNGGVRLLDGVDPTELELTRIVESPYVTHLTYEPRRP
jgi:dihydrofolate reductase